ncbi:hypothetical protein HGRIS_000079 [Hohenbuehelia grisea]|uniref:Uncharacterized protein n=1 Tax=Hohenbuehelia grisea TaxID=104357 RepID=A0ABR3JRY1_9AGAR
MAQSFVATSERCSFDAELGMSTTTRPNHAWLDTVLRKPSHTRQPDSMYHPQLQALPELSPSKLLAGSCSYPSMEPANLQTYLYLSTSALRLVFKWRRHLSKTTHDGFFLDFRFASTISRELRLESSQHVSTRVIRTILTSLSTAGYPIRFIMKRLFSTPVPTKISALASSMSRSAILGTRCQCLVAPSSQRRGILITKRATSTGRLGRL